MNARPFSNYSTRARIGLIVPPTNTVNEAEWMRMLPEGVTFHTARMPLHADTTSDEGKRTLYEDVRHFVGDLAKARPDVIAYACTAGSMVTPIEALPDFMRGVAGIPAVATAPSLVMAARSLGVTRVTMATPYHDALNEHERHFLADNGIEVLKMAGLGIGAGGTGEYGRIAQVPLDKVYAHARSVDHKDAQALMISCTDFSTLPLITRLESELGIPVITSNTATLWAALRAAITDPAQRPVVPAGGRLLNDGMRA